MYCVPLTCMCQTESPKSEVRGGVGDAAQAVLYGVDGLVQEHVRKVKLQISLNKYVNLSQHIHTDEMKCKGTVHPKLG